VNRYKPAQRVKVRIAGRTKNGVIVKHHPSLPAWVVSVNGRKHLLNFLYADVTA
jgi:hypothetical protein